MANDKTPNYHWGIPNPYGIQFVEMMLTASTFGAIDAKMKSLEDAYMDHRHSFSDISDRPTTLEGYGITDALPVKGGALTGALAVDGSLYIASDYSRYLWFRKRDGTTQGLVYNDVNNGSMNFRTYSEDGSSYSTISLSRDGKVTLPGFTPETYYHAATKKYVDDRDAETVKFTGSQSLSLAQKQQARSNIDALGTVDKGAAGGVASLDATGKIPSSQLPPIAITETFVVNSQASMLALAAQSGDVAVRADLKKSFILRLEPASVLANWQELLTPTDAVLSVNGKTGVVSLSATDVGAATPAQVDTKLDKNNPSYTGSLMGGAQLISAGLTGNDVAVERFKFTDKAAGSISVVLRGDGGLSYFITNPDTGAWLRTALTIQQDGQVVGNQSIYAGGGAARLEGNGNIVGPIWSLSGTADLASYISKLTDGKTAVEMGTFHFTNEDWPYRETTVPWAKCLAFCISKTNSGDDRRRPRKLEGQHNWGWETWASMAGANEFSGEISGDNTTGQRTMFTMAYTTMGRFRVNQGWGQTSERVFFLRIA